MHKAREDFVKAKIKQLQQYYAELGDETVVSYEEEQTSETEDFIQEYKKPQLEMSASLFIATALGITALAFTAARIIMRQSCV
ncbi:hypothetical protein BO83DRAFT_141004 [Aspergillus eucalypticola CBS 122712]|uniref:Uncharacterized protein n=1 Tax=Aspergillus eucalypticola (strain CBS 122712 / IBT 29274) TaxID=1448314 RepID=A0A317URU0_ASPEC|nr:uncharacterized protein BO83DRAFT_141004 [Aspergillus eucalypticola CBS 122712]PWY64371.1 hypothetical protein BO83DRAFT_141004 [Aspergillus eucalypticola CBS 122712]